MEPELRMTGRFGGIREEGCEHTSCPEEADMGLQELIKSGKPLGLWADTVGVPQEEGELVRLNRRPRGSPEALWVLAVVL